MKPSILSLILAAAAAHAGQPSPLPQAPATNAPVTITVAEKGKPISPDLFGIFFEDLNYAADGGLYGELIQNRSFDYDANDQPGWNPLTSWEIIRRSGAQGGWAISTSLPLNTNNPRYLVLDGGGPGADFGIANGGFDGIPVKAGETYDASFFARQLYMNGRWGRDNGIEGKPMPVTLRLEAPNGEVLAEASLQVAGRDWKHYSAALTPSKTENGAKFLLLTGAKGGLALDEISLFPGKTFKGRSNGLRADLAQAIADIHPKFMRFPGGCLTHGDGTGNIYRWKETLGPVEQRKSQHNLWGYHQTKGLGYFEFFQFCEDIGAKPLPVLAAGVSCQNSDSQGGTGQQCIPMEEMPAYIQDTLDLIEWANGPADSKWGSVRAAAGHPQPFHLEYLGIGNEDAITPDFEERFKMIRDAVQAKHPEITVIGTVGPMPEGVDFDAGWKFAKGEKVPVVDEHYYMPPRWFLDNLGRYDSYDRNGPEVYVGEYAAHDTKRRNTLRSALAEAAFMTQLERNGDVVRLASYAPLLARHGHTQWSPDAIYFDGVTVSPSLNYEVQKLFASNSGDTLLPVMLSGAIPGVSLSCVRDSKSGAVILKIVNTSDATAPLELNMPWLGNTPHAATRTVLSGDPDAENAFAAPPKIIPLSETVTVDAGFAETAPPHSLTVIRIPGTGSRDAGR